MSGARRLPMETPAPLPTARAFACGSVLVTVRGDKGRPRAVRALAFNSVSLEPAIVVWVIRKEDAPTLPIGHACGISVLAQLDDACNSAPLMHWQPGDILGVPLAMDALASFEAIVSDSLDHGDEVIQFARLASFCRGTAQAGFVSFHGEPHRSKPL